MTTTQRATVPRVNIGQSSPVPVIGRTEVEGGRVYYVRWGASVSPDQFGLDSTGRGVRARITRTALGEYCGVSPVPYVNIDTDFGDRAIFPQGGNEPVPIPMPSWEVDLDTGIYIPHGMTAQIEIVGGDPASPSFAWPVFHSRVLAPQERPPPLRHTYQDAPARQTVVLTSELVVVAGGLTVAGPDVLGAVSVSCPENVSPPAEVEILYGGASRTIRLFPGVAVSLTGAIGVNLTTGGHYEFQVEL